MTGKAVVVTMTGRCPVCYGKVEVPYRATRVAGEEGISTEFKAAGDTYPVHDMCRPAYEHMVKCMTDGKGV